MSVCSQMGNGQTKEGKKKKKKDHVKEETQIDDDSPQGMDGSLHQEGLDQFYKERSRRKDMLKDLANQSGTNSLDSDESHLNAESQDDCRNIGNPAPSNEVKQGVQVGKDPIGAFGGDSSLANGHVTGTGNESDMNCGDIVTNKSNQVDPVRVDPAQSSTDHPHDTPGTYAPGGASRVVAVGTAGPSSAPGNVPSDVPIIDAPRGATQGTPGDVAVGTATRGPVDVRNSTNCNVPSDATGGAHKGDPEDVPDGPVDIPSNAPGGVPAGTSRGGPVDVHNSAHGNVPSDATRGAPKGDPDVVPDGPVGVPSNAPGGVPVSASGQVTNDGPCSSPLSIHPSGDNDPSGEAPCGIPTDIPGNGPIIRNENISDLPAQSGLAYNPPSRPDQTGSGQKRIPTTGDYISSNLPEEQNDYQSFPPTPQSKIESKTPSDGQMVTGMTGHTLSSKDKSAEKLKVSDQLVSKVVTDNALLMEKLSKYLDRESRVIKCWKHLAYVLNVPAEERGQFDMYTEHSPTEDLFNFLADIWNPDLTVQELKVKLKRIHRNDLIGSLDKEGFQDTMKVCDLVSGQPRFIKLLSTKLDMESRTIGNWKSLATEFGVTKKKTEQFGLRGSGPTGALFLHMRATEGLRDLTMAQLEEHFEGMGRKDLVNLLSKEKKEAFNKIKKDDKESTQQYNFEDDVVQKLLDSRFVKDVLMDGSELLADIGERLNKEIAAIKNWRNLAYRLKIPHEIYSAFDTSKGKAKSPTKLMFEWLANWKPDLNIGDLLKGIKEIDRADVVEIVTKEAKDALKKAKKDKEDSTQQFNSVDGAAQQLPASQALQDLQEMRQDADKKNDKTTDLLSDLKKNAEDRGFIVIDNQGRGDCMFYALSEQLGVVKGIRILAEELRKNLVLYLKEHPKLPDGTKLFDFTDGYPSWLCYLETMARPGNWGDHVILVAAANVFNTPIRIVSSLPDHNDIIINPDLPACLSTDELVLGHVHEQHYVSLLRVHDVMAFHRGNTQAIQGGQGSHYFQSTQYGEPSSSAAYANQQGNLHPMGHYRSQGHQQRDTTYPSQGYQQHRQDHYPFSGYHPQERYQPQGSQQSRVFLPRTQQQQQLTKDQKEAMKVLNLPSKDVYSKICIKLNIRRDMNFDDFRMVAEELGLDRETTEYAGQQPNPTDFIFLHFCRDVTVGQLVNILHKIERMDVATVLENWIEQGST